MAQLPHLPETARYTASEVEARTGVPATTLRQWERRYGVPRPARGENRYRLYSAGDIHLIQQMQVYLRSGVSASRAAQLALGALDLPGVDVAQAADLGANLAQALSSALLNLNHQEGAAILARSHALLPVEEVLTHVISPALVEIGQRWEQGEITVAHEHQATAWLKTQLAALLNVTGLDSSRESGLGPLVLAACAPGEEHELGLMMLTLALRRRGVRVLYLGANLPLADLAVLARQRGAQGVALALNGNWALGPTRAQQRDLHDLNIPVFYGGALLNERPELAAEFGGVYAGPDATQAAQFMVDWFRRTA